MKLSNDNQLGIWFFSKPSVIQTLLQAELSHNTPMTVAELNDQSKPGQITKSALVQLLLEANSTLQNNLSSFLQDEGLDNIQLFHNENYAPTQTAREISSSISIAKGKFDIRIFEDLPDQKLTLCLGMFEFIRIVKDRNGLGFQHGTLLENNPKETRVLSLLYYFPFEKGDEIFEVINKEEGAFLKFALQLFLFIKMTSPDIKYLEPGEKTGSKKTGKHINATSNGITIVDGSWNTVTKTTDGFEVRGHWRWQPIGEGRKDKKRIWIQEFRKDGYTRNGHRENEIVNQVKQTILIEPDGS